MIAETCNKNDLIEILGQMLGSGRQLKIKTEQNFVLVKQGKKKNISEMNQTAIEATNRLESFSLNLLESCILKCQNSLKGAHVITPTCENLDNHGHLLLDDVPVG